MHTISSLLLIATICLAALGLARDVSAVEEAPPAESDAAEVDDPVLATVNGQPIHQSDVERLYEQLKAAGRIARPPEKELLIEELIKREAIRQFALDSKIEVDDAEVDARLAEWKEIIAAEEITFEQFLEQQHLTEQEIGDILRVQIALEKLAESRLTEEELASLPEEVQASHILVKTSDKVSDEDAQKKILFIKSEIEKGHDFAECAKVYSDCPSARRGGDLGFFPEHGAMVEPFAKAAYALKQGEISEPVKTEFGYHLIMVTGRSTEPSKKRLIQQNLRVIYREIFEAAKVERLYKEDAEEEEPPKQDAG